MLIKIIIPVVLVVIFLIHYGCVEQKIVHSGKYEIVTPERYYELMSDFDSINLIDVRTKAEYNKLHLPGAVNASFLSMKFEKIVKELNLDPSKPTFIYCETAHRSPYAAKVLIDLGFVRVIDLKKGMMNWRKKDMPVEKDAQ